MAKSWIDRLQNTYENFEEFEGYCEIFRLHNILGFGTVEDAWNANPIVGGSVNPKDYGLATPDEVFDYFQNLTYENAPPVFQPKDKE